MREIDLIRNGDFVVVINREAEVENQSQIWYSFMVVAAANGGGQPSGERLF